MATNSPLCNRAVEEALGYHGAMKTPARPIRERIGILLLLVILFFTAANHAVDRMTLYPRFLELERQQALLDLERCRRALDRELHHLSVLAGDWAAWDDTHRFAADRNQAYIDANLMPLTFYDNHLDLIALFEPAGGLIWGAAYDAVDEHPLPLTDLVPVPLPAVLRSDGPEDWRAGVEQTRHGAMLFVAHPILTSENEGPVHGTFIMGRLLCEPVMTELRAQTGVAFEVMPASALHPEATALLSRLREGGGAYLDLHDASRLRGFTEMADTQGNPAIVIGYEAERVIVRKAREAMRSAFLGTLGSGLAIWVSLLVLLGIVVVAPLQRMAARVVAIAKAGGAGQRLAIERPDEIGVLGREFDALLTRIERDVREKEAAASALQASERRLSTLLDAAPNAVLMVGPDGRIESANPACAEIFGRPASTLAGRSMSDLLPVPLAAPEFQGEVEAHGVNGGSRPVYAVVRPFPLDGAEHRVVVATDLSEFKQMHAAVLRSQHLAALGQMGATVAHELRNPIAGISNAVEVLRDGFPADAPRAEMLEEMQRQSRRMARTVKSLLDFARPWSAEAAPLPVAPVARRAWESVHALASGTPVDFRVIDPAGAMVMADEAMVDRILRNVFENALHALGAAAGVVEVEMERDAAMIRVRVRDTGPGVPSEMQERVFQPFVTTRTAGVGLGLSVCRTLAEAQGGSMAITNTGSGGAEVTLLLPAAGDSA